MASLTCLAFGVPVGTADPSGSNEQGPPSSPEWTVAISIAVSIVVELERRMGKREGTVGNERE
jgi:hypothetical protein